MIRARPAVALALTEAQGLVLADDVVAQLALPVFDNSAMDGYAVRAQDILSATPEHPVVLPVAEDIPAGRTGSASKTSRVLRTMSASLVAKSLLTFMTRFDARARRAGSTGFIVT